MSSKLFSQYIRAHVFFNCLTTIIVGEAKIIYQSVQGPMGPVLVSLCKGMIIFANECVFYVKKTM